MHTFPDRPSALAAALALSQMAFAVPALALHPPYLETFTTDTGGWGGESTPTLVPSGGPGGAGDQYLSITSNGTTIPELVTASADSQWTGDYTPFPPTANGTLILGASVDLANFGDAPLSIRAIFFSGPTNQYSTLDVAIVPPDGQWRPYEFSFDPQNGVGLLQVSGATPVTTGMTDVTSFMFRHNVNPAADGDPIAGSLGIDNIGLEVFIPAPSTAALLCIAAPLISRRRRAARSAPQSSA